MIFAIENSETDKAEIIFWTCVKAGAWSWEGSIQNASCEITLKSESCLFKSEESIIENVKNVVMALKIDARQTNYEGKTIRRLSLVGSKGVELGEM